MTDWNERARIRRNVRQAPAESDVPKAHGNRDTRRWCRGKVGVEHKLVVASRDQLGKGYGAPVFEPWLVRYCATCGKEFDSYSSMSFAGKREPPEWAATYLAELAAKKPAEGV